MEGEIINLPSFKLIGIVARGPSETGIQWIQQAWEKANEKFKEVTQLIKPNGSWGFMSDSEDFLHSWQAGKQADYLAGWELKEGAEVPEGWSTWEIPSLTYAKIACTMLQYNEAKNYLNTEFIPAQGYERAGAMHEFYPWDFKDVEKDSIFLYVIVRKKQ